MSWLLNLEESSTTFPSLSCCNELVQEYFSGTLDLLIDVDEDAIVTVDVVKIAQIVSSFAVANGGNENAIAVERYLDIDGNNPLVASAVAIEVVAVAVVVAVAASGAEGHLFNDDGGLFHELLLNSISVNLRV